LVQMSVDESEKSRRKHAGMKSLKVRPVKKRHPDPFGYLFPQLERVTYLGLQEKASWR